MLHAKPPQPSATPAPPAAFESAPAAVRPERMSGSAVLWVALAIFAQESVWNFYDAQVPAQLRHFVSSATVIGLIMGLDTGLGVIIQPWMGLISDRLARRRLGRWPIVVAGACVAAVPFALIPWATSLPMLMLCIFAFGLTANSFKGVTETLVSDYVVPGQRGKAQGFIKAGVSLTIIVSALISLLVVDHSLKAAFAIPPILMIVMVALSYRFLGRRHPAALRREDTGDEETDTFSSPWAVLNDLIREPSRTRLLLMAGIFCFAGMWAALRSLTTPYGTEVLGMSRGAAGGIALPGAIAFLICVVPLAYLSHRLGELRMIRYGIALFVAGLLVGFADPTPAFTAVSVAIASIGYAVFSVNGLVALWSLAPNNRVLGAYTGLYTVASASGMALGPALLGATVDLTGWRYMLLNAAAFGAVTFAVFTLVARRAKRPRTTAS
ncbi:MFS transporter [Streptomyces olivochromogenes]|uniref:MFS transporter n=1 Tax=Streptomyces olivochromogenes TaxID=1963 RepID=A0A250VU39_STROL|nr:MFS transporter [Streptomyces olivochromogenes]GAX57599.1 MFS transporter [Streptomyces olivochromogenes]